MPFGCGASSTRSSEADQGTGGPRHHCLSAAEQAPQNLTPPHEHRLHCHHCLSAAEQAPPSLCPRGSHWRRGHHCLSAAEQAPRTGPGRCREHHRMVTIAFRLRSKLHFDLWFWQDPTDELSPLPFGCGASSTTISGCSFPANSPSPLPFGCGASSTTCPSFTPTSDTRSPLPFGCGASSTLLFTRIATQLPPKSPLPFGCGASSTTLPLSSFPLAHNVTIAFRLRSKLHPHLRKESRAANRRHHCLSAAEQAPPPWPCR